MLRQVILTSYLTTVFPLIEPHVVQFFDYLQGCGSIRACGSNRGCRSIFRSFFENEIRVNIFNSLKFFTISTIMNRQFNKNAGHNYKSSTEKSLSHPFLIRDINCSIPTPYIDCPIPIPRRLKFINFWSCPRKYNILGGCCSCFLNNIVKTRLFVQNLVSLNS